MKVGIAGTGRMGTAVARGLIKRGHEVRVWNRTPDNAHDALQAGARWAPTPNRLAVDSEVTICCLFDDEAVERVYLGADGLLTGRVEGRLFIDMSTVSPGVHHPIEAQIKSRHAEFIECPVSGSPLAARFGMLVGFAAGEAAAFARAQPLLSQLCRRVEHVGPLDAGARTKLADNLLLAVFWQALGESLLLLDTSGIDAARAVDLLADSNIGATILRTRALQIVAAMNGNTSDRVALDIDTARKGLFYLVREATAQGYSLPLTSRTLECFNRASGEGQGSIDTAAYPAHWIAGQKPPAGGDPSPDSG